jgi:AP-1 complex subunit mu
MDKNKIEMACHAIYFLDLKGKVILNRNYRGDLPPNVAQRFISRILEEEEESVKPIFQDYELSYIYLRHSNLYCKLFEFMKKLFFGCILILII